MKALVYTGPGTLERQDVNPPVPAKDEVLIDVEGCGICGSDMHAFLGHDERRPAPLILGHEVAGYIAGDGARVTINPLVTCGTCRYCTVGRDNLCPDRQIISIAPRQGGFAEQVAVPRRNVVSVPDGFPLIEAALVEPLACGWHAVRLAIDHGIDLRGERRAIVIGGGAIGLGAALALKAKGALKITILEPDQARAGHLLRSTRGFEIIGDHREIENDPPADLIIDGVGLAATRELAFALIAPGGMIAHIGLGEAIGGLDPRRATLQEVMFLGTYTYTAADFRQTAAALFDGRLHVASCYEVRGLDEGPACFTALHRREIATPKIILRP